MISRLNIVALLSIIITLPYALHAAEQKEDPVKTAYKQVKTAFLQQDLGAVQSILQAHSDTNFKKEVFLYEGKRGPLLHTLARSSLASYHDRNGHGVLLKPSFKIEVAQEFFKHGGTVALNTRDKKQQETPLLAALSYSDGIELVEPYFAKCLVEAKADVSLCDSQKRTPLTFARGCQTYHAEQIAEYPSVSKLSRHATRDGHIHNKRGFDALIVAIYAAPTNNGCCVIL